MADADHFCLIWNNFQNSILSALGSLQSSQDLVDVTLMCEGQNVRAHKVILSACSPYFRKLFKEHPTQHPIIILKDVSHYDLTALLQFMYQGEVLITQECLSSFLKTAELLQVSGLAGAAAASAAVTEGPNALSRATPEISLNPPDSPATVINKINSELSLTKPNAKEKNMDKESENKITKYNTDDTDPLQSCSYQPPDCINIKTESEDRDFEDMVTDHCEMNMKDSEDHFDDTSTHSEEPSILERSLKAHSVNFEETGRIKRIQIRKRKFGHKKPSLLPTSCPYCSRYITQARNLKQHLRTCKKEPAHLHHSTRIS